MIDIEMPQNSLFHLLRISLGVQEPLLEEAFDEQRWKEITALAKEQAVLGMVAKAMMMLPPGQLPPLEAKVTLGLYGDRIARKNRRLSARSAEIYDMLTAMGLDCRILKGQGMAALYPDPLMRQCGDIDVWVQGGYRDTLRALRERWKTGGVFYHHVDIRPFEDKTQVEVHFRPTWLNNPFRNRRLQRWQDENASGCSDGFDPSLGYAVPGSLFNCVYGALHIYRHLLFEGVGLRQITDYFLILKNSTSNQRLQASLLLEEFGLGRFLPALMYVLQQVYSLPQEYFLVPADPSAGSFLLDEVMTSGNFGHSDHRFRFDASKGPLRRLAMRMSRLRHYYRLAPSEVLWAPVFKIWQGCWKAVNRF